MSVKSTKYIRTHPYLAFKGNLFFAAPDGFQPFPLHFLPAPPIKERAIDFNVASAKLSAQETTFLHPLYHFQQLQIEL